MNKEDENIAVLKTNTLLSDTLSKYEGFLSDSEALSNDKTMKNEITNLGSPFSYCGYLSEDGYIPPLLKS